MVENSQDRTQPVDDVGATHSEAGAPAQGSLSAFVQGDQPTASLPNFSLVIPTYRQAGVIRSQVTKVLSALDELGIRYEVIVVVDGDHDGTKAQLATIEHRSLRVAVIERNRGKGSAVRRGLLAASSPTRGFLDGGGDIGARWLIRAYEESRRTGADIVVASKLHPQSVVEYPLLRRLYSWGYRQFTRMLFGGLSVRDTQAGLKIYSAALVEQVFPHVRAQGFAFDVEALALAWRLGFRQIVESPVVIRDRYPSTIGLGTVLAMLWETLRVWWIVRRFAPNKRGVYRRHT